ncbi:Coenzyme F420 hydrogenase/dehydrogenase, beta subunit C-terminal domain [Methanocaldococcus villosus]|uniref:Coenzyme F420 hydrogenase/dehydrogenase, beta subunit C-terminal domain n=1 Tax=Methanocaldococcus villosus TaxID=667126 RepID=UPI00036455CD|nr:Coenzyme F420 hydrogenase/dehydrogenase, beta subunit C-terminal domain [Methanocaldococcus villosus]
MEWKLSKIYDTGFCSLCSTCSIVCPNNLIAFDNRPYLKDECLRKGNGMCFEVCPRVSSGKYQIKIREGFKEEYYYGKSDIEGQDGGVVTKFLLYLLENNKIDAAIVVGDENWKPVSLVVKDKEDLLKTSKSKYFISTLEALKEAAERGFEKVAVVGLPCQINGLRKLQYFPYLAKHDFELGRNGKPIKLPKIEYLIGLFCHGKFSYESVIKALEKRGIKIEDVKKFDIKKDLFVYLSDRVEKIPLEELEMCSGCKVCRDFTSELADVSVGSVGSPEGYSTIIIRTKKGEEIKNAIELKEGVDVEKIKKLAEKKIKRFKKEIERRKENNEFVSFYWTSDYGGVGKRADGTYFIRIRAKPAGFYDKECVKVILDIVDKYNLRLKVTDRQGFELHNVSGFDVEDIIEELNKHNIITGSEGPLVRVTLACPGEGNCSSGIIKTEEVAKIIEENFKEYPAPYKFKIAISGCPNKCVRPNIHDIGIVGVRYPKVNDNCNGCGRCYEVCKVEAIDIRGETSYTNYNVCIGCGKCIKECPNDAREVLEEGYLLYIGGKSGREVVEGVKIGIIKDNDTIIKIIDNVLKTYKKYAKKPQRERLSAVMERVGKGKFLDEVMREINI